MVRSCVETNLEEEEKRTFKCKPPELLEDDWQPAEVECMFKAMFATFPVCEFVEDQFVANEMEAGLAEEEQPNCSNLSVVGV